MSPLVWGLVVIGVAIVLFAYLRKQQEPFEVTTSVLQCANNKECTSCADMTGCGWCAETGQCVDVDRSGIPIQYGACDPETIVMLKDQCPPLIQSATAAGATSPPLAQILAPGVQPMAPTPAGPMMPGLQDTSLGSAPAMAPAFAQAPAQQASIPMSPATLAMGIGGSDSAPAPVSVLQGPTMSPGLAIQAPAPRAIPSPATELPMASPSASELTAGVLATGSPGMMMMGPAPITVPEIPAPSSLLPGVGLAPAPATVNTLPTTTASPFPVSDAVNAPMALSPPPPVIPKVDPAYTTVATQGGVQPGIAAGETGGLIGGVTAVGNEIRIALNAPQQRNGTGGSFTIPPAVTSWIDQGLTLLKGAFPAAGGGAPVAVGSTQVAPNREPSAVGVALQDTMPSPSGNTLAMANTEMPGYTTARNQLPSMNLDVLTEKVKDDIKPNVNEILRQELARNGLSYVEGFGQFETTVKHINASVRDDLTSRIRKAVQQNKMNLTM